MSDYLVCWFSRMWHLDQDDNFALSLENGGFEKGEFVNSISFNKSKGRVDINNYYTSSVWYVKCMVLMSMSTWYMYLQYTTPISKIAQKIAHVSYDV